MEDKLSKSYIERIEIKGLWGRFDVDWTLHSDVNILVGENGTGKSTILKFLESFLKGENTDIRANTEFMKVILDNGKSIGQTSHDILPLDFPLTHPVFLLKTFDAPFYTKNERERIRKPYITSTLDDDLDVVMDKYVEYQLNKSNQLIFQKVSQEKAFGKKILLIEILNRLFKATGKTVNVNDNKLSFHINGNGKVNWYELSSGEKQLLIILLTVLCQDEKPSIILLDEPEISMHLRWQYELIEIIRTLNPNCQVIIVTHSPSIFSDGWNDRVFWIEDICKPSTKVEHA
jgi:predicted ATPase